MRYHRMILFVGVCPLKAFLQLQCSYPVLPTDPFLSYHAAGCLFLISQLHIHCTLKRLILRLNFNPHLTFIFFRSSWATLAFAYGILFQAIKAHSTWSQWAYIDASARDVTVPQFISFFCSSM
jgi:hypothetical protein